MLQFSSGKLNNMITTDVDKTRRALRTMHVLILTAPLKAFGPGAEWVCLLYPNWLALWFPFNHQKPEKLKNNPYVNRDGHPLGNNDP